MKPNVRRIRIAIPHCIAIALGVLLAGAAGAQSFATTTIEGTVYLANGRPASGTLLLSWPAFTTAANQVVAAGRMNVNIGVDGLLNVALAPNVGASPAGLFYTAVFHLSDGTTSTEYWVVPAAGQVSLTDVRSKVMPAAQAMQTASKAYVDESIQALAGSLTPGAGGAAKQADQFNGPDFGSKLQACIRALDSTYGGICDARNFSGNIAMNADIPIATGNANIQLPCATIVTSRHLVVTPGTRDVTLHGCASRGTSNAGGDQGGTVFLYSGSGALIQVGDPAYAANTLGFHLDNVAINTTVSTDATAQAIAAWRTQELNLQSVYLLGNTNQTGITLDGTGNYTGGTLQDVEINGFGIGMNAIGHQADNPAFTDWFNASSLVRVHINCPTSNGNPVAGTIGINLQQGDGNTIVGGDVEGCSTALHLGPSARNNTIVGLRNENSTYQVAADAGSAYNSWVTGGTMFTGKLVDSGTRNSFLDTFHRSFNGLNGDWFGSQQDSTITNHYRLGIGTGTERGLLHRYQTDYGYRWTLGLSDASAGEQFYQVLDELNNVYRLSIGQYNPGQSSTNNQTVINAAGTGAIVLNGSNNAGTGGVVFGSGGPASATVATVDHNGNAHLTGTLLVDGTSQSAGTMTVRNNADAEVDYYLWPGITASQKGAFTYKDWNGESQWYMVKDANNNWALNSAIGGLDSFKAYQSTNSGDTYINASNSGGHVRINYESGSGSETDIYSNGALDAAFLGSTSIKFPGLASASGSNCLQIDHSGYISNTGAACSTSGTLAAASGGTGSSIAPAQGQIPVGNSGGTAYAPQTLSGDATLSSTGVLTVTGTNSTAFGTAATRNTGTSGANLPLLNTANTWSAGNTTFANGVNSSDYVVIQPGSTADQIGALEFANYAGTSQWEIRKDAANALRIRDMPNSTDRVIGYAGGQTVINSGGSSSVAVNNTSSSGTGGFIVYQGGANYNTAAFTVTGSGNATITGTTTLSGHLNQSASGKIGGSCTMSSNTTCTVTLGASFTTPLCVATVQGSTPIAAACSISGTTATVTAASANSAMWAVFFFGNPN